MGAVLFYELSVGRHDAGSNYIWGGAWDNSGGDAGGAGFLERSGNAVHYDAWNPLFLDGVDADCKCIGTH